MSTSPLLERLRASEVLPADKLTALAALPEAANPDPRVLGKALLQRGWLTRYQINQVASGKGKELLVGLYLLLDKLGEGGMGQVFKARHRHMARVVALKLMRKEKLASADSVSRFYQEVTAAAQLVHPNIVLAFDAGQWGNTHFFSMEYIDGPDLARVVHEQGPLPVSQACEYIRQAALGLQHAHQMGLVHRDIKPANLLVGPAEDGVPTVKILDMGLARLSDNFEKERNLTADGQVIGTPDYLAPEQAMDARKVDIRAHIYSLGCSLYFLLTGNAPFQAVSLAELFMKHQMSEAPSPRQVRPEVPKGLDDLVRRMMAKKPEHRPQTPAEVAAALAPFIDGNAVKAVAHMKASSEGVAASARKWPVQTFDGTEVLDEADQHQRTRQASGSGQNKQWLLWGGVAAGGLLVVALIIGAIAFLTRSREKPTEIASTQGQQPPAEQPPAVVPNNQGGKKEPDGQGEKKDPVVRPIDWNGKVELVKGKMVPGRVAAFIDDQSFVTHTGSFLKRRRIPDGAEISSFNGHDDLIRAAAVSPDRKWMASSDLGKKVLLWDLSRGQVVQTILAKETIQALAFSPDGKRLAGGGSPNVWLWEVETGNPVSSYSGNGKGELINQVAFTLDGLQVASGGQTFRLWDTRTGATNLEVGPMGGVMRFAMSKDGGRYYLATSYRYLSEKTPANLRRLTDVGSPMLDVAFTADGQRLVVGSDGLIGLADPETGELFARATIPGKMSWQVVVAPSGRYLAARGREREESHLVEVKPASPAGGK